MRSFKAVNRLYINQLSTAITKTIGEGHLAK